MTTPESAPGLFSRASRLGVMPGLNPIFAKRIILTNLLGFMFTINMTISALAFLYFGHTGLALFTFCFAFSELCWPLLNRAGHYTLSRAGMLISSNVLGFFVSIALPGTGYNKGFYVMAGLPILLFDIRERGFILLGFLLPLILYPVSEWVGGSAPFAIPLTQEMAETIGSSIAVIYIVLVFLMFYFLARENNIAEAQLEEQRLKSFTSAKFASLGEMASGITHEINNPLTALNLQTQNLRFLIEGGEKDKNEALTKVDLLFSMVHRIARIVESMSMISREGGQDPLKEESLKRIVEDTTTFCSERFKKHNVKFTVNVPDNIMLNCRAVQVSQLLLNLLNNAFDAIEPLENKWITLDVSGSSRAVWINVTDSGLGIPAELREKIFDPFFTTKPAGKGTGLGLSLSSKIAQEHCGRIFLDTENPNTRFIVEFLK